MTILVTGASGYLGWNIVSSWDRNQRVIGTFNTHQFQFPHAEAMHLDFTSKAECDQVLTSVEPDTIIHAGAMTKTTECEQKPASARTVNIRGTQNLLAAAAKLDRAPLFVYISTDLVFDGTRGNYAEEDSPAPLMEYGRTKSAAECLVKQYGGRWAIVRAALMYGEPTAPRPCFLDWMLDDIRHNRGALFTDEYRNPIYVGDVVAAIARILEAGFCGILHCGGPERLSRHAFGLVAAEAFRLPVRNVHGAESSAVETDVPRPRDVSMNISRLRLELGISPLTPLEALRRIAD